MTQTRIVEYAETSLRLLDEAERYLEADDLYKACEKGLEAIHGYLRAVAEPRGWACESQRDLYAVSSDLAFETEYVSRAISLIGAAEGGFGINFDGAHHTDSQVATGIRTARKWLAMMENRNRPPPEVRDSQLERDAQGRRELRKMLEESRAKYERDHGKSSDRYNNGV